MILVQPRVTIKLADRSVQVSKRKINDVLIWVGEFIYAIDFIVLETQLVSNPRAQTPVILERHSLLLLMLLSNVGMGL